MTAEPLIHIPLYCWRDAPDYAMRGMVEQHLVCLESYFAHGNTYDLLVTTNDRRPLEIFWAYKQKTGYGFKIKFVTDDDLLSVFKIEQSLLEDIPSTRTIFSKFYPILNREADAIVHIDFDTMFTGAIDLTPLLVSDISLVDANQFMTEDQRWEPTNRQAEFFNLENSPPPQWNWLNSGVFAVQRRGFDLLAKEISHYFENLERAVEDEIHDFTDEIIMNALAIRERDSVSITSDYRLNFLAYYLQHDPAWTTRALIVHFQSLKPDKFWYIDGALNHRCDTEILTSRVNEDVYLAVLMWYGHLHAATEELPYLFRLLEAIPADVVERELAARCDRVRLGSHDYA
jgi:hypothetical protein